MEKEMFEFYKNALLGGGITKPICDEYKNEWRACGMDKERLVRLAMRQQSIPYFATFAYANKGLSKEYLKKEFGYYINGYVIRDCDGVKDYTYGLYVDYDFANVVDLGVDVSSFMWCEDVDVEVEETKCPVLYISNKSNVRLTLDGYNTTVVYLFDESVLTLEDGNETSKVLVYKYSDTAQVIRTNYCDCKVNVFDKKIRL